MNNKMIALLSLAFFSSLISPAFASQDYCLNTSYAQTNFSAIMDTNGVPSNVSYFNTQYCINGCSNTLGYCRGDKPTEMIMLLIFVIFLFGITWLCRNHQLIAFTIVLVSALTGVVIGISDLFTSPLNIVIAILPLGLLIYGISRAVKEDED